MLCTAPAPAPVPVWTEVTWTNRFGETRVHRLYRVAGSRSGCESYARHWWTDAIASSQGNLTDEEARASQLRLDSIRYLDSRKQPLDGD